MALTLDFNIELYPLHSGEEFSLALSSSLERDGGSRMAAMDGEDSKEEKERDVWRPDGKGRRGLDDDYEYVMYGKVRCFPSVYLRLLCSTPSARSISLRRDPQIRRLCS
jgi:hypothetical protein